MAEIQSWQRQSFAKNASTGPSKMNGKIAGNSTSFHSKIAKPTVHNYADGGEVNYDQGEFAGVDDAVRANKVVYEDDVAPRVATDDEMRAQAPVNDDAASTVKVDAAGGKQSFKQAFAENRKAGNATFEWNGKKFNTEVAEAKPIKMAAPKRAAEAPRSTTLVQDMGKKFAEAEKAAKAIEMRPDAYAGEKARARAAANEARKAYEDAADAQKTGKSVVFKR